MLPAESAAAAVSGDTTSDDEPVTLSAEAGQRPDECTIDVVQQAAAGDTSALATIYDHYVDLVYRFCYYWTGQRTAAEQLTERTFQTVWTALRQQPTPAGPFSAWLLQTCQTLFSGHPAVAGADQLRLALHQLLPDQRAILLLRTVGGYSTGEVAATLQRPAEEIERVEQQAIASLDQALTQPPAAAPGDTTVAIDAARPLGGLRRVIGATLGRLGRRESPPPDAS